MYILGHLVLSALSVAVCFFGWGLMLALGSGGPPNIDRIEKIVDGCAVTVITAFWLGAAILGVAVVWVP